MGYHNDLIFTRSRAVESIHLQQRKTKARNGETLRNALIVGRYNEQATRPQASKSGVV
jgi:hypothetical protein